MSLPFRECVCMCTHLCTASDNVYVPFLSFKSARKRETERMCVSTIALLFPSSSSEGAFSCLRLVDEREICLVFTFGQRTVLFFMTMCICTSKTESALLGIGMYCKHIYIYTLCLSVSLSLSHLKLKLKLRVMVVMVSCNNRASVVLRAPVTNTRGLRANERIKAGETVMTVPLEMCVTTETPAVEKWMQRGGAMMTWQSAMAAVLLEQKETNNAALYAASLPWEECATMPICWTWDEMQCVHAAPAAMNEVYAARALAQDGFRCVKTVSESDNHDNEDDELSFFHAIAAVHSRTFFLHDDDSMHAMRALVPVLDMCNHGGSEAMNVDWSYHRCDNDSDNARSACVRLIATRDIDEGDELLTSYGDGPNDKLFVHNGFVPSYNADEAATLFEDAETALEWILQLEATPPSESMLTRASSAYSALDAAIRDGDSGGGANSTTYTLGVGVDGRFADCLVDAFAFTLSSDAGPQAHAAARHALHRRCEELLRSFPTTLSEDLYALRCGSDAGLVNAASPFADKDRNRLPELAGVPSLPSSVEADVATSRNDDKDDADVPCIREQCSTLATRLNASKKLCLCAGITTNQPPLR